MSIFVPYVQRKTHVELKPADFVRIQNAFYVIDEVRKFRRWFDYEGSETADLIPLTGSLRSRFQHIDKFAVVADPATSTVQVLYRGTDITGLQFGHLWNTLNAAVGSPAELGINSFSREDIIRVVVTCVADTDDVRLWWSGEEYTLVEFPKTGGVIDPVTEKGTGVPERFVLVVPYGFSRVMTHREFEGAEISHRLRT